MINHIRYIWQILTLSILLLVIGMLILPRMNIEISFNEYLVTLLAITVINLTAYLVMTIGIQKNDSDGVVIVMAGVGLKFLLHLGYILGFWLVTRNLLKPFIITFFALYLVYTFLLARRLFKLLKNK